MNSLNKYPHWFLWAAIPVIAIMAWFTDLSVDIPSTENSYYIESNYIFLQYQILALGLLGLIYFGIKKVGRTLRPWLTVAHLICTIDTMVLIWLIYLISPQANPTLFTILMFILFAGQFFFLANLFYSMTKNKAEKSPG